MSPERPQEGLAAWPAALTGGGEAVIGAASRQKLAH